MTIIGITGIIGTGKTTAAKHLAKKYDYTLIETDKVGHMVLGDKYSQAYKKIKNEFETTDRKELGKIVFNDPEKLKKLEEIMHPEMYRLIDKTVQYLNYEGKSVVIEAAVLYKIGLDKLCDKIILIKSSAENIKKRLKDKGMTNEEITAKLKAAPQITEDSLEIIENNDNLEDLKAEIDKKIA